MMDWAMEIGKLVEGTRSGVSKKIRGGESHT